MTAPTDTKRREGKTALTTRGLPPEQLLQMGHQEKTLGFHLMNADFHLSTIAEICKRTDDREGAQMLLELVSHHQKQLGELLRPRLSPEEAEAVRAKAESMKQPWLYQEFGWQDENVGQLLEMASEHDLWVKLLHIHRDRVGASMNAEWKEDEHSQFLTICLGVGHNSLEALTELARVCSDRMIRPGSGSAQRDVRFRAPTMA